MQLYFLTGDLAGETCQLIEPKMTLGREVNNDVNCLVVGMSRYHAVFDFQDSYWILKDLGSTNGSIINNVRIERPQVIQKGDILEFGKLKIEVKEEVEENDSSQRPILKVKNNNKPNEEEIFNAAELAGERTTITDFSDTAELEAYKQNLEPIEEPVAPVIEEVAEVPVEEPIAPVIEEVAEVAEVAEVPVEEPIAPVIEEVAEVPVEEPVAPVIEEVAEVAEVPVEEPVAPVIEEVAEVAEVPIEEPVAPVIEEVAEVAEVPVAPVIEEVAEVAEVPVEEPLSINKPKPPPVSVPEARKFSFKPNNRIQHKPIGSKTSISKKNKPGMQERLKELKLKKKQDQQDELTPQQQRLKDLKKFRETKTGKISKSQIDNIELSDKKPNTTTVKNMNRQAFLNFFDKKGK